ncbi:MAG: hypothetical protein Q9218_005122 [Villophora microphyllina]
MDPISVAASLGAIIQLSTKAAQFLKEIKHGSEDRIKLREGIRSTACLLEMLQDRVEDADGGGKDLSSIKMLGECGGPLDQLRDALEQLIKKLGPRNGLRQMSRALLWPLSKEEAVDLINIIERQKTAFSLAIQNDNIGLSLTIKTHMTEMSTKLAAMEDRSKHSLRHALDQEHQEILAWLSPLNFWPRQQDIIGTRTEGTGTWLLASDEFRAWRNCSKKILWCHGIPGAGKTVLASVVVENLMQTVVGKDHAFAFIYCNYKERAQQTYNNLVSSLIRQLIEREGKLPNDLGQLYHRHSAKGTRPNQSELVGLLGIVALEYESLYFVIDALDECDDSEGTRSAFVPSLRTALPNACVLVTSRPWHDINLQFDGSPQLEIRASDHDIKRYLSDQILHQPRLKKHTQADPSLLPLIEDTVVSKSDGMFLLARLHVGALATKYTRKALRSALQNLPTETNTTYDEALQRIKDQSDEDASLAKSVFLWVSLSPIPLTVRELQHAIGTMSLDNGLELDDEDLPDSDILIGVCAGLVVVDKETSLVRLVHYTIQVYFESKPVLQLSTAYKTMTKTCITYLSLEPFQKGPCKNNEALRDRFEVYPFVRYAAQNWGIHARGEAELVCCDKIVEFLSEERLQASTSQASHVTTYTSIMPTWERWWQTYPTGRSSLAVAASFGLTYILQHLLEKPTDVDGTDNYSATALICAADGGHTEAVKALLDAGAHINKADVTGRTALIAAATQGRDEAVELLLARGADIDAATVYGRTALLGAVWQGHRSTVMLLFDKGASKETNHILLDTAIAGGNAAMARWMAEITSDTDISDDLKSSLLDRFLYNRPSTADIEVLIEKGASLTPMGSDGKTAIHLASQKGHVDAVRLFLERGVSADIRDGVGKTPLHFATFRGSLETVKLLLSRGANIRAQNYDGETVLHTCLHYEPDDEVVSLLLHRGVGVDIANVQGQTPLHGAARRGHGSIVKMLIDHGADPRLKTNYGWTPLQEAAASGMEGVIDILREQTAATCLPSYHGLLDSARFRKAIAIQNGQMTQELLSKPDIDVNLPDCDGRTSLHHAAYNGQTSIAETLLARGASVHATIADAAYINAVDYLGHIPTEVYEHLMITPLHNAAHKGHADIAKLLLSHGADINGEGCEHYTPLEAAIHRGHANVVGLLLERGARAGKSNGEDRPTLLYWSAVRGDEEVVRLLLEHGPEEENNRIWGRKALVLAIERKFTGTVKLLKDYGFTTAER